MVVHTTGDSYWSLQDTPDTLLKSIINKYYMGFRIISPRIRDRRYQ